MERNLQAAYTRELQRRPGHLENIDIWNLQAAYTRELQQPLVMELERLFILQAAYTRGLQRDERDHIGAVVHPSSRVHARVATIPTPTGFTV